MNEKEFQKRYNSLKDNLKKELDLIGLELVKKEINGEFKELFEYGGFRYYLQVRENKKELDYFKFKEEFGRNFRQLSDDSKESLIKIGLEKVKKDVYGKFSKIYSRDKFHGYLKYRDDREGMIKRTKEIDFINEFGCYFSRLSRKDKLVEIGFENVLKEINGRMKRVFEEFGFNGYLDLREFRGKKLEKEFHYMIEYSKFVKEFGVSFGNLDDSKKEELIKFGLEKILEFKENHYNGNKKNFLTFYLDYVNSENKTKFLEIIEFKKEFGKRFSNLKEIDKELLLNIGIEKVKKDVGDCGEFEFIFIINGFSSYDGYLKFKKNKRKMKEYLNNYIFEDIFESEFTILNKEEKEKLFSIGSDEVVKDVFREYKEIYLKESLKGYIKEKNI